MYIIDKSKNRIEKIESTTFKQLGFKERENLQEWIRNNPSCLNEDLLIIQKEFAGFSDTNERLDLLAIDKQGNLVIIENKLDDTGRDATWQALKYSSYCATLIPSQIIIIFSEYLNNIGSSEKAEEILEEFLETEDYREKLNSGNSQRIIMISGEYRKEVTSLVLWLLNYGLKIQCFKATPFKMQEQYFLNMEQIIPIKEAEDFVISMANKSREEADAKNEIKERHIIRKKFWTLCFKELNKVTSLYQDVKPGTDHWISAGSGSRFGGAHYSLYITRDYCSINLVMSKKSQDENKAVFDKLFKNKAAIESDFGNELKWDRMNEKKMSYIDYRLDNVNIFNEEDWARMIDFMVMYFPKFENAFKKPIQELSKGYKS